MLSLSLGTCQAPPGGVTGPQNPSSVRASMSPQFSVLGRYSAVLGLCGPLSDAECGWLMGEGIRKMLFKGTNLQPVGK